MSLPLRNSATSLIIQKKYASAYIDLKVGLNHLLNRYFYLSKGLYANYTSNDKSHILYYFAMIIVICVQRSLT